MVKLVRGYKKIVIAGLILAIFILGLLFFFNAGNWLIRHDPLHKADAVVVLMGSTADRLAATKDVFEEGVSQQIILVNDFMPGNDLPAFQGHVIPSNAQTMVQLATEIGMPDSVFTILPGEANSTKDEADSLAAYLRSHPEMDTLVIISSSAHTKRASIIFKSRLRSNDLNIQLIMYPSPYSDFNAEHWWQDRNNSKTVALEYAKLLYFCLYDKFK
jgi:uncharacterized SAM-binding protein YcdF (DUF218 family)